ncbi:M20 family metallopeptidase [Clostridium sediminicola]|uniref:M20 metallopeptidase family protein n=1 Tax=Clostridium sediminicola TaxID=3114879 RepID=UPI0031F25BD0
MNQKIIIDKEKLYEEIDKIIDWVIDVRRDFHMNPELGMEEYRTNEKIKSYLDDMEIQYKTPIANTGILGMISGIKNDNINVRTVALRADMDALPIIEENKVEYKSKNNGKMHACGHDVHMAVLLGTARILKKLEKEYSGNIKLIFQPAEETVGGAKPMIEAGIMENPKVDAVFGLHVAPELDKGKFGIRYGKNNASSDTIKIVVIGESTHGAYPHSGIDAIAISGQIISALQNIVSRNVDPVNSAVVTIGSIHGGTRGNIIADEVEMIGTVRTLDDDTRSLVLSRIKSMVESISKSMGGNGKLIVEEGYTSLINENSMVDLVRNNAQFLVGEENIKIIDHPSLGVEDFAYYLKEAKGAFFRLGCRNEEKGIIHDGHHKLFDVDEECLKYGIALQVLNVLAVLQK